MSSLTQAWALRSWRRSVELCDFRSDAGLHRGSLARVVDHVGDSAVIAQGHCNHVMEADLSARGHLDGAGQNYIRIDEHAVDAQTPRLMSRDSVGNFV